jgi:hypothetical protein
MKRLLLGLVLLVAGIPTIGCDSGSAPAPSGSPAPAPTTPSKGAGATEKSLPRPDTGPKHDQ